MHLRHLLAAALLPAAVLLTSGMASAHADDGLREAIGDKSLAGHWIYSDLPRAEAVSRSLKKPLLVVFRCVPCQCASQLDADLTDPTHSINELLRQYVCCRVVHMAGVDLTRYQFDWDVSLVALMIGPDGTVYGRYGSRAVRARTENTHISTASFQKALERALVLHAAYPRSRAALAGKQPREIPLKTSEDVPELARIAREPTSRKNCVHCHMAGEALLHSAATSGTLTAQQLAPFPLPDNLGLSIDKEDGLAVKAVRAGSAAAKAGLAAGDRLIALDGQSLVSQADIQWVLHHAPEVCELTVVFERAGKHETRTLSLSGPWRTTDTTWRPSLNPLRNGLHLGQLSAGERKQLGIAADQPGFLVRYAFRAAGKAGLRPGWGLVEVDGQPAPASESELLRYLWLTHRERKSVELGLIDKNRQPQRVMLPLQMELVPE